MECIYQYKIINYYKDLENLKFGRLSRSGSEISLTPVEFPYNSPITTNASILKGHLKNIWDNTDEVVLYSEKSKRNPTSVLPIPKINLRYLVPKITPEHRFWFSQHFKLFQSEIELHISEIFPSIVNAAKKKVEEFNLEETILKISADVSEQWRPRSVHYEYQYYLESKYPHTSNYQDFYLSSLDPKIFESLHTIESEWQNFKRNNRQREKIGKESIEIPPHIKIYEYTKLIGKPEKERILGLSPLIEQLRHNFRFFYNYYDHLESHINRIKDNEFLSKKRDLYNKHNINPDKRSLNPGPFTPFDTEYKYSLI